MKKPFKRAMLILVIIFALIIGSALSLSALNKPYDRNDNTYKTITIEEGSSTDDIATVLYDEKLIRSKTSYKILSKIWRYDGKYLAGMYSLSPSMTPGDIGKKIVNGEDNANVFTVPEGSTIYDVADIVSEQGIVDREDFIKTLEEGDFSSFEFLDGAQKGENHLEGYLFPNTYKFAVGADSAQLITTMLNGFDNMFTDEYKERAKELGLSLNDVVIIASIIERESVVDEDRAKIASVIYNRLDEDMALQMCSTIQYLLGENKEKLSEADTQIDSPYNTYINKGLPPGPICSPGEASIRAALYPEDTDYIYFVVSEKLDGSHNFSKDYDQFLKDKDAYYKALDERDAKNS